MALAAGTRLGPYEILEPLGAGGMGEVYRARDARLGRTVAVKVLPSHLSSSPELRSRLEREARAISQLSHPHICTLYDVGREGETDFLVMEYLEGETLAHRLEKGHLPLEQALRTASEIADALDMAHRQGVVHRDLKPGNVMLTKSGAKLLDFGLAKLRCAGSTEDFEAASALPTQAQPLTEEGKIVGTYPYMAPEQLEGKAVDARTDRFGRGDLPLVVVLMAMFAGLQEGSLCLNLDQGQFLNRLPVLDRKTAKAIFGDFLSGLAAGRYQKLITTNRGEYLPLILDGSSGRDLLYFQKYHVHEKRLKDRMEVFLKATVSIRLPDQKIDALIDEIYADRHAIRVGPNNTPIASDPQQLEAIRLTLKSQFSIISGGPGTGKTSLMVNILRCLVRENIPVSGIILGAPTGRAAQRMTETLQNNIASIQEASSDDAALLDLKGSTLHKILGYRSYQHEFYYRETNPLPASVVVVDEVSMVDVVMLDKFLQAVDPEQTKLILLGDKNQLPSVEAGAVFAEMIPDGIRAARFEERFVVLQKVYRSGTNLLELANQANKGSFPSFKAVAFDKALSQASDQWAFIDTESFNQWQKHLHQWINAQYLSPISGGEESYAALIKRAGEMTAEHITSSEDGRSILSRIFSVVERARILSFLRNGMYGCTVINDVIADQLIHFFDPSAKRQSDGFSGALVIITRNDYSKELFNGDVGVIIKDAHEVYRAIFHRSGTYISFPVNLLPSWEFAFAMTVHKSQGSEFDDVLLVLPDDENHRLLTREIVYTGITRAKKRVLLYGSQRALNTALQRKIQRQSGLMW